MTRTAFHIDIQDQQTAFAVDLDKVRTVIERVLIDECVASAEISVALVDDQAIHKVNRDFLGHDYPTDVISFRLNQDDPESKSGSTAPEADSAKCCLEQNQHLDAELVISTETAVREAAVHGWSATDELLLYVVHGTLHLCGYDDLTDEARPVMRDRERKFLAQWHLVPSGLEA